MGADGGYLRGALFPAKNHRATAVLMSGRSEFIEKYFEVCADLNARGISVAMMDWRGQGLSERLLPVREKGHIQDFGVYRSDLAKFTEEIATKEFAGPYILMTHSMGGPPGLQLLADGNTNFKCAVLCAPMTRLFDDPVKRVLVRLIAKSVSALGGSRQSIFGVKEDSMDFADNALTSDVTRHNRFRDIQLAAPNAMIREPTYGWLRAAFACMDDLHAPDRFSALTTPILIVSAEDDRLVCPLDHHWLARQSPLIECITVKAALHEVMMEADEYREQYWQAFDNFVGKKLFTSTAS